MQPVIIGVDFDNTIVSYDILFYKVALEQALIPLETECSKNAVKKFICEAGNEPAWTRLQGEVYGPRMHEAIAYPGVKAFFRTCKEHGIPLRIISHKTRYPYIGEPYDLHAAATRWLDLNGFFSEDGAGLSSSAVFFETTKEDKICRIVTCECTHFIDDLPEILTHPQFPKSVGRNLFSPGSPEVQVSEPGLDVSSSWFQLSAKLIGDVAWEVASRDLAGEPYAALLPLRGGANNQVYSLGENSVVKRYFHDEHDKRDRFRTERAFYDYCRFAGIKNVPDSRGWLEAERVAAFARIDGLQPSFVEQRHVDATLQFALSLNAKKDTPEALALPAASEACFSLSAHLQMVSARIQRMAAWKPRCEAAGDFHRFVAQDLIPTLHRVAAEIKSQFRTEAMEKPLSGSERCISPSDFGFHNSIESLDGSLAFLDFEYAGWDDPAKMVCDFFCQPRIPVDLRYLGPFSASLATGLRVGDPGRVLNRCKALLPLYCVKWSAILLNEFASDGGRRRYFSTGTPQNADVLRLQLEKARIMLGRVATCRDLAHGIH